MPHIYIVLCVLYFPNLFTIMSANVVKSNKVRTNQNQTIQYYE